jgi:hypothetical protein
MPKKKIPGSTVGVQGRPGLPDGILSDQKSQFGYILEVLAMEDDGIFCCHLVYFTAFGTFYGYLLYFSPFWYVLPRKIWQPCGRLQRN